MRLGVLDVGSNTVHLLLIDGSPGARPEPYASHKIPLQLVQYLDAEGNISQEGADALTHERAVQLLADKRAKGPVKRKTAAKKTTTAKKTSTAKKTTAKKTTAKSTTTAKKTTTRKTAAKKTAE